jgi:hypothetical protein
MGMGMRRIFPRVALSVAILAGLSGCFGTMSNNQPFSNEWNSQANSQLAETESLEQTDNSQIEADGQSSQEVDFRITGGCYNSYEELGSYAIFEEFDDDCYLIVECFPPEPARYAELQYFDETWIEEPSGETDSGGVLYLKVDPICDNGLWCDGVGSTELPSRRGAALRQREVRFSNWISHHTRAF